MACTLISSFPFACRDSNGGALEMKVKVFDSTLTGITETSGTVTMASSALTGWYTLYCAKQTASVDEDMALSVENGTVTYTQVVNFVFNKLQVAFRNELKNYAQNQLHIAVKDNNGVAWLFGYTRGMDLLTAKSSTGTAYTDRSGYVLAFNGMEPNPMVAISNYSALVTA